MRSGASRKAPSSPTTSRAWPCASRRRLRAADLEAVQPAEARVANLARTLLGQRDPEAARRGGGKVAICWRLPRAQIEIGTVVDDPRRCPVPTQIELDLDPGLWRARE